MYCFVKITWWPFLKRVNTGKYLIKYDGTELSLKLSMGMVFQCWGSGSPKEGDYFSGSNRIPFLIMMMMLAMEKPMNRWNLSWKQKMGIISPILWYLISGTWNRWCLVNGFVLDFNVGPMVDNHQKPSLLMVARPQNIQKTIDLNGWPKPFYSMVMVP